MARARGPAYVPARKVLAELRDALAGDREWAPGLTTLIGDDAYHLDLAQKELIAALVPADAADYGLTVFGDQKVPLASVVHAARSVGMFSDKRVVLVRDLSVLDGDPEPLAAYAEQRPRGSYLIIRAPQLDRRRKLHQLLVSGGQSITMAAPPGEQAARLGPEVAAIAKGEGLDIDRTAAVFLAEACAGDFYRVANELRKLRAFLGDAGDRARVDIDLLRRHVAGSGLLSGWEIADALLVRDRSAALAAVRRLVESGDEPIRIVGGLAWRARTMLQAKALLARRVPFQQVVRQVRAWPYQDRLRVGMDRYRLDELLRFPGRLLEADRILKSRGLPPATVLEQLVDSLISTSPAGARG